ncbi:MAG TPA: hypothetical protein VFV79_09905, partial [Saprospiraceae bacterium]|nr:hypothetical protein [Saprospiraceae bacterium]
MQKWEYTFPQTSEESWIRQVEKDLKGKPVESLYSEWWPGEPLVPFHYSNGAEPIILPDFLFKHAPQVTEAIDFDGKASDQINNILHEALQFGTQTFLVTKEDAATELEGMLDGIFSEMINWHFYAHENVLPIYSRLVSLTPDTTFMRIKRSGPDVDLNTAFREKNLDSSNIKFEYTFPADGNWIEDASLVFQM